MKILNRLDQDYLDKSFNWTMGVLFYPDSSIRIVGKYLKFRPDDQQGEQNYIQNTLKHNVKNNQQPISFESVKNLNVTAHLKPIGISGSWFILQDRDDVKNNIKMNAECVLELFKAINLGELKMEDGYFVGNWSFKSSDGNLSVRILPKVNDSSPDFKDDQTDQSQLNYKF